MCRIILCAVLCLLLTGCSGQLSSEAQSETAAGTTEETTVQTVTEATASVQTTTDLTVTEQTTAAQKAAETEAAAESEWAGLFDDMPAGIRTQIFDNRIVQTGSVNGQAYSLTVDLQKWAHLTSREQIVTLTQLFWECYPRMFERFHDLAGSPSDVTLAVENEGYAVAEEAGGSVHLHDNWLHQHPEDYDCITHELAHAVQADWDADYLEYSDYIERFADCCRYEYAMQNGCYNDAGWDQQTVYTEDTREKSVRFLVWLDYFYSDAQTDILRSYFRVCHDAHYPAADWDAAWQEIFAGTALAGTDIDAVWEQFAASDFAVLSSAAEENGQSELLRQYAVRERLRQRT